MEIYGELAYGVVKQGFFDQVMNLCYWTKRSLQIIRWNHILKWGDYGEDCINWMKNLPPQHRTFNQLTYSWLLADTREFTDRQQCRLLVYLPMSLWPQPIWYSSDYIYWASDHLTQLSPCPLDWIGHGLPLVLSRTCIPLWFIFLLSLWVIIPFSTGLQTPSSSLAIWPAPEQADARPPGGMKGQCEVTVGT